MAGVMAVMVTSFKRTCASTLQLPGELFSIPLIPSAGHCLPMPLLETPGHLPVSLAQSLLGSLLLSPRFWCTQDFVCALQEFVSPVLYKFWQLSCGVNGNLLQEGLWNTQLCCTQSHCWPVPLQETLKHKGRSCSVSVGSPGVHNVLFEPSEHLWWVWGLIVNAILPLL